MTTEADEKSEQIEPVETISFMIVRIEGDVPDKVARVAYQACGGVLRAWNEIAPADERRVDVELLTEDAEGKQRQRRSVLERLYKEGWDR